MNKTHFHISGFAEWQMNLLGDVVFMSFETAESRLTLEFPAVEFQGAFRTAIINLGLAPLESVPATPRRRWFHRSTASEETT